MLLGYNTNGLAHHSLPTALELLAEIGYRSVAITIDHAALNPYSPDFDEQVDSTRELLGRFELKSVIETGARYLLDPRHKHEPTLLASRNDGRPQRIEFLRHAIDVAAALESNCVSLWSGVLPDGIPSEEGYRRLAESLQLVLDYAERKEVIVGFEPEPGMLVDEMSAFQRLLNMVRSSALKLTLDVGHLHCLGETPIPDVIHRWADQIVNVHIEDMVTGVHEHLMFGEGEMDFPPILAALGEIDYQGPVHVELSRHSHEGPATAQRAFDFLVPMIS